MTVRGGETDHRATSRRAEARPGLLTEAIEDIERGLRRDDPDFVRRMQRLPGSARRDAIAVVGLLVVSAVLLTLGLATPSSLAWVAGGFAFLGAFAVDRRRNRRLGGPGRR
jgi:hypothetical protein